MDLESVRIFVKVVQHGGFSKAATTLKIPTSTISRTISRLEAEVGAKLLSRTTRSISPTPAGQALFDRAVAPTLALEDALKSVEGTDAAVTGAVRITATEDLGALVVTPIVGRLAKLYPRLSFELAFTNEVVDLVKGGFDLALPSGLRSEDAVDRCGYNLCGDSHRQVASAVQYHRRGSRSLTTKIHGARPKELTHDSFPSQDSDYDPTRSPFLSAHNFAKLSTVLQGTSR